MEKEDPMYSVIDMKYYIPGQYCAMIIKKKPKQFATIDMRNLEGDSPMAYPL